MERPKSDIHMESTLRNLKSDVCFQTTRASQKTKENFLVKVPLNIQYEEQIKKDTETENRNFYRIRIFYCRRIFHNHFYLSVCSLLYLFKYKKSKKSRTEYSVIIENSHAVEISE